MVRLISSSRSAAASDPFSDAPPSAWTNVGLPGSRCIAATRSISPNPARTVSTSTRGASSGRIKNPAPLANKCDGEVDVAALG